MSEPTDEELLAAFVAGERRAFEALVRRYERRVYAICFRYFRNAADAEDAAQDAFLLLYRRAATFSGASSFSTWMYRVAMNACNDLGRKRARRPQAAAVDVEQLGERASAEDEIERRELALELQDALAQLDADQRDAILAHDVGGVPYADIAARAGVAVGTVKSRIHRGHARLAALLDEAREPSPPGRPPTS